MPRYTDSNPSHRSPGRPRCMRTARRALSVQRSARNLCVARFQFSANPERIRLTRLFGQSCPQAGSPPPCPLGRPRAPASPHPDRPQAPSSACLQCRAPRDRLRTGRNDAAQPRSRTRSVRGCPSGTSTRSRLCHPWRVLAPRTARCACIAYRSVELASESETPAAI